MTNFAESGTWDGVRKWETGDQALAGGEGTPMNLPLSQLVNRDNWIKTLINQICIGTTGILGTLLDGTTCANFFTDQQNDNEVATTAFVETEILRGGRKNVILNGDFRVAQRKNAFHIASGSAFYTLDRWFADCGGTIKSGDLTQEFAVHRSVIKETYAALKGSFTGAGSLKIKQRIPGVMHFENGKCVLSFAFHSDQDFDMNITFSQMLTASQVTGSAHWSHTEAVGIATGFHYYHVVFTPASLSTIDDTDLDASNCIEICFNINTSDIVFWMTEVQLQGGELPGTFEQRDDTLACLEFYEEKHLHEKWGQVDTYSGHNHWRNLYFTRKRIAPRTSLDTVTYSHLQNLQVITTDESSLFYQVDEPTMSSSGYVTCEVSTKVFIDAEI